MAAADRTQAITDIVKRYIELVGGGGADDIAALYADDATVEDPVGGEVHIGRQAIHGFYSAVETTQRECELVTLRVCGHEAAFHRRGRTPDGDRADRRHGLRRARQDHRDEGLLVAGRRHPALGQPT
jgi:ketosteroid isomerase-like protein